MRRINKAPSPNNRATTTITPTTPPAIAPVFDVEEDGDVDEAVDVELAWSASSEDNRAAYEVDAAINDDKVITDAVDADALLET